MFGPTGTMQLRSNCGVCVNHVCADRSRRDPGEMGISTLVSVLVSECTRKFSKSTFSVLANLIFFNNPKSAWWRKLFLLSYQETCWAAGGLAK